VSTSSFFSPDLCLVFPCFTPFHHSFCEIGAKEYLLKIHNANKAMPPTALENFKEMLPTASISIQLSLLLFILEVQNNKHVCKKVFHYSSTSISK